MSAICSQKQICGAVLAFISVTVFAFTNSDWALHSWLSDDGLPNNSITSIAQTRDGYLWVANPTALARFDGVQFETFSPKLFGVDPNQRIRALIANREGGLWLALDHGLILAKAEKTQIFTNISNISPEWLPQSLLENDDGSLWMTFNHGVVCRFKKNGELIHFTSREGMPDGPTCSLIKDNRGQIWFAKSGQKNAQVGFYRDGYFQTLLTFGRPIIRLAAAHDGKIWICNGSQLLKYDGEKKTEDMGNFLPEHPDTIPSVLMEDSHGALWIGTSDNGLFRFDGTNFEEIPTSNPQISDLMEDREGNIWVGTRGGGLDRLQPRAIELEGTKQGLPFESVMSLCEDTSNTLWAVTQNNLLAYRKDKMWNVPSTNENLPSGIATCVASGHDGAVWIGTRSRTLYCLQNGKLTIRGPKDGIISGRIRSLLVASNGDVWIGGESPDALQCLRNGAVKTFPVSQNIHSIRTMAEDSEGNIWAGSSGGLLRITHNTVTDETTRLMGEPISPRYLCATPDGSLWIGCDGDGLIRLKDERVSKFTTAQGLYDDYISQIVDDDHGWLWFGSDRGIFKVEQNELSAVAEGKVARLHPTYYGRDEGFSSLQANFGVSPGAIRSRDGRVWIPMRTGLASINPGALTENPTPPTILLRQIMVDDRTVAAYGGMMPVPNVINLQMSQTVLRLPPSFRRVQLDFVGLNFSAPENVHFRYRLDGFDDDWVETETHDAIYPRLNAGNYKFHIQARNENSAWNDTSTPLTLVVAPFFWQTWWFQMVALFLFTSAVIAIVRYISFRRLRLKLRTLEQQAALDKERARIARDIHDDLGGSMTQITLLSGLIPRDISKPEKATDYANRISSAAKNVTESLDEIVWAVNPRNDTLPHLINYLGKFTSEYFAASGLKCRMNLPQHPPEQFVSSDTRHNLFLAVKEALNNITRHSNASEVVLKIVADSKLMNVIIEDNGRGFNATPQNGTAEGLHNMRQRMQDIGGQFQIESKPGGGTKVNFIFPLSNPTNEK